MEVNGQFHTMADLPSEKEDRRNPWIRDSMGIIFGQKSWNGERVIPLSGIE